MGFYQFITHAADIINIQLRRRMRIQHGSLVNIILISRSGSLDGKQLHIDIGLVHCCQLHGQAAYMTGIDSLGIDHTRNLHTGIGGKVINQPGVQDVSANLVRLVGHHRLHDVRSIFPGTFMGDFTILKDIVSLLFPFSDLLDTASGIFIQRNVEFINHFRITGFDKKRIVLRVMLAGFGAVVA